MAINAISFAGAGRARRVDDALVRFDAVSFAVGAWVYLGSVAASQAIANKSQGTNTVREFALQYSLANTKFQFFVVNAAGSAFGSVFCATFGNPTVSNWYYVLAYFDNTNKVSGISVNGGAFDTAVANDVVPNTAGSLTIGARETAATPTYDLPFTGRIQELSFWFGSNAVPTQLESAWLYNSGNGRNWWEFGRAGTDGSRLCDALGMHWPLSESTLATAAKTAVDVRRGYSLTTSGTTTVSAGITGQAADDRTPTVVASTNTQLTAGNLAGLSDDFGGVFTQHDVDTGVLTVAATGKIYRGNATTAGVRIATKVRSRSQRIEWSIESKTTIGQSAGVVYRSRGLTGSRNEYLCVYNGTSGAWELSSVSASTATLIATFTQALTNGQTYSCKIESTGIWHQLFVDGTCVFAIADDTAAVHAGGYAGYRISQAAVGSTSTGFHLSGLKVSRGTWETDDAYLTSARGGSVSTYGAYHVSAITNDGTYLYTFSEGRYTDYTDGEPADLLVRRSALSDPFNWGSAVVVKATNNSTKGTGKVTRNTCPVVLANGDLLVMFCQDDVGYDPAGSDGLLKDTVGGSGSSTTAHVYMTRSTDQGATWSAAQEITDLVKDGTNWAAVYTGPGPCIRESSGRVVMQISHKVPADSDNIYGQLCYTDSFIGQASGSPALSAVTWTQGGLVSSSPNPSQENGLALRVIAGTATYYDSRRDPNSDVRHVVSTTAVGTNLGSDIATVMPDPSAHGDIENAENHLFMCMPHDPQSGQRRNMTLRWTQNGDLVSSLSTPGNPSTAYPHGSFLGLAGAQYGNMTYDVANRNLYVAYGYGGQPNPADWTQIMGAIAVAKVPLASLGILPVVQRRAAGVRAGSRSQYSRTAGM